MGGGLNDGTSTNSIFLGKISMLSCLTYERCFASVVRNLVSSTELSSSFFQSERFKEVFLTLSSFSSSSELSIKEITL